MKLGGIIGQALLGGVAGAAQGAAMSAIETQKNEALAKREEALAKLRGEERRENLKAETAEMATREEQKRGIIQRQMQSVSAREEQMRKDEEAAALARTNSVNTDPSTNLTPDEVASMPAETRKLYDLPVEDEQTRLRRRIKAGEQEGVLDAAKEARGALQTEVNAARDTERNRIADKRADTAMEYQRAAGERADNLARIREANAAKVSSDASERMRIQAERETRLATKDALTNAEAELKRIDAELKNTIDPAAQEPLKLVKMQVQAEAKRYRTALAGSGIPLEAEPEKPTTKPNRKPLTEFQN
jgi:hypothetical protein